MKHRITATLSATVLLASIQMTGANAAKRNTRHKTPVRTESTDTTRESSKPTEESDGIARLTEVDYKEVASRLGIEVATIKAVVEVEAGRSHEGFYKAGLPLINFDMSMFRKFAKKNGINLSKYYKSHAVVFSRPSATRYGSTQGAQQERLRVARTIDAKTATEGCFWGMFQIGGFNWRKCGCASIEEFVDRMSRSEREQLELFADFITNSGMLQHLRNKNWSAFARIYNGASYASRGYHKRLANAYTRYR